MMLNASRTMVSIMEGGRTDSIGMRGVVRRRCKSMISQWLTHQLLTIGCYPAVGPTCETCEVASYCRYCMYIASRGLPRGITRLKCAVKPLCNASHIATLRRISQPYVTRTQTLAGHGHAKLRVGCIASWCMPCGVTWSERAVKPSWNASHIATLRRISQPYITRPSLLPGHEHAIACLLAWVAG